jgi:hypothetical protein
MNLDQECCPSRYASTCVGLSTSTAVDRRGPLLERVFVGWTHLFGLVSFQVLGRLEGSIEGRRQWPAIQGLGFPAFGGLWKDSGWTPRCRAAI